MLQDWIEREERSDDEVTLPAVRRLAVLLDRSMTTGAATRFRVAGMSCCSLLRPRQSTLASGGHPYHTLDSLLDDPHLADVQFSEPKEHPTEGKIRNMRLPNKWSCGTRREWNPAPKLGQNSVEVLREVGYTETEIEQLIANQVIADGRLQK
jgi:hypothetical protein